MGKFTVNFEYKLQGEIEVEADTYDEAEEKAETQLNDLRDMGSLVQSPRVTWSGDEVEI